MEGEKETEIERELLPVARTFAMKFWWRWYNIQSEPLTELDLIVLEAISRGPAKQGWTEKPKITEGWTVSTLHNHLHKTYEQIHEIIYNSLQPKGLVMIKIGKGSGRNKYLELTNIGKTMLYWADIIAKENLQNNIEKLGKAKK